MLEKILQMLSVKCRHRNISQPFSAASPRAAASASDWDSVSMPATHYVVCLDCGRKFQYDWQNMRIVPGRPA
jgi:hypothetical protein